MRNQDREREIRLRSKAGVTYEGGKDSISFRDSDDLLYDDDDIITSGRGGRLLRHGGWVCEDARDVWFIQSA